MKAKKILRVLAVCLVLAMAVAMAVSAATSTVELRKTMYYVSGSSSAFASAQAQYSCLLYTSDAADE